MDDSLEKSSRTLKEARRGSVEIFAAIVAALVGVIANLDGLNQTVQIILGVAVAVILISTAFRFFRVKKYRREDHRTGRNRKSEDE